MGYAKYLQIGKTEMLNLLSYSTTLLGRGVFMAIILFIFFNLWRAIYGSQSTAVISGFTFTALMWYLVASESAVAGGGTDMLIRRMEEEIKSGEIAYRLNKPYNLVLYYFMSDIGPAMLKTAVAFAFASALVYALVGSPLIPLLGIPFTIAAFLLSRALQFFLNFLIGISAFWVEDVSAFRWINEKLIFLLGGMLIPLNFFPPVLQKVASVLPYSYMSYAPAYMFVNFSLAYALHVFAMQAAWIAAFGVAAAVVYGIVSKRVSINGG